MTPYFSSFGEFLQMGGHGFYVWLCYAIVFVSLFGLVVFARQERTKVIARLSRQQAQGRLTNKQRKQQ